MSRFWSKLVHELSPYVPGEQPKLAKLVKLNTNENPYGPSPRVIAAIQAELGDNLRLYPDPVSLRLREAAAIYYGIKPEQVFVGNGSDEVLAHVFHALLQHDQPILFPDITYSFYPVYSKLYNVAYQTIPLADDFSLVVQDYVRPNGGIIFPNPNAPTGRLLAPEDIEWLLEQNRDSVVVIDEAYIDFGGESAVYLIDRFPNLLVIQTFSKSRSLAGLRVGMAFGQTELLEALIRVKDSFNSYPMDRLALAGATAAMEDRDYFETTRNKVIESRLLLSQELQQLGFQLPPSAANFVFARHPQHDAAELAAKLRTQGVIVRHFKQARIDQYLRITIGTEEENLLLISALKDVLRSD
ncbi:MAG: histidinol-phosphate transaminase [Gammaproteobacteria bacterium]|nr:histidinol-phosphate transaminase [Gammaproteobacteria bacterium]MDH5653627.1 histidinol-phosphate transaminase [Gammaproteobacteria bacterium]